MLMVLMTRLQANRSCWNLLVMLLLTSKVNGLNLKMVFLYWLRLIQKMDNMKMVQVPLSLKRSVSPESITSKQQQMKLLQTTLLQYPKSRSLPVTELFRS